MPFPLRFQYPGAWHHIMNRGANHQVTFLDSTDRKLFLALLAESVDRTGLEIHAYCLMGNHFHVLARTPTENMDSAMQYLGSRYTKMFNQRHGRDGALFRGRYRSILIESERYLLAVSRYIHRNPIDLGIENFSDYPWSSYGEFLGRRNPQDWLHTDFTLQLAGGKRDYRGVVQSPVVGAVDLLYATDEPPVAIGSAEFVKRVRHERLDH